MEFALVYQVGIANVFRRRVGDRWRRLFQGSYHTAETLCAGAKLAGGEVSVWHCDEAGDIQERVWESGPGELWADKKLAEGAL